MRNMKPQKTLPRQEDDFDPSEIDDPIAGHIDWTPIVGGANFCTHRLVMVGANRLEFRPTGEGRTFGLYFIVFGLVIGVGIFANLACGGRPDMLTAVVATAMGLVFTGVGFFDRYRSSTPIVFDRIQGLHWKGRGPAPWAVPWHRAVRFNEIHAIQLVRVQMKTGMRSSYELILVLKDTSRASVVSHGGRQKLLEDAATLSQFLERPLWNGINDE